MALRAIFGGSNKRPTSSHSLNTLEETQTFKNAVRAVTLIMNDDVDGAERELNKENSPFHKVSQRAT